MDNPQPQNNTRTQSKPKPFWHLLVIVGVVSLVVYLLALPILRNRPAQYPTLDYDTVMRSPDAFKGEKAHLDGTLSRYIRASVASDNQNTFLLVREHDNESHLWVVYGRLTADEVSELAEGSDISVNGMCAGATTLTLAKDDEATLPTLYFVEGALSFNPPSSDHQLLPTSSETAGQFLMTDDLPETSAPETSFEIRAEEPQTYTLVVHPEASDSSSSERSVLPDSDDLERKVAERRERFQNLLTAEPDETEDEELAALLENYVRWYKVNTATKTIHERSSCSAAKRISTENASYTDNPSALIAEGYTWCGICH